MPSLTEGLPDAALESLACETPVIASAVGEIPYVLREGKCGWIIWNYGVDTFVKALKEALTDHETLKNWEGEAENSSLRKSSGNILLKGR